MEAKAIEAVVIIADIEVPGDRILETRCNDYDNFVSLPEVIVYENRYFGKSGWNSDLCKACYKASAKIALSLHEAVEKLWELTF